jgi:hypothetical protein
VCCIVAAQQSAKLPLHLWRTRIPGTSKPAPAGSLAVSTTKCDENKSKIFKQDAEYANKYAKYVKSLAVKYYSMTKNAKCAKYVNQNAQAISRISCTPDSDFADAKPA